MNPKDLLSLLPPLPSLSDLDEAQMSRAVGGSDSVVGLSDEEFNAVLQGNVSIANSGMSVAETAEAVVVAMSPDPQPATVSSDSVEVSTPPGADRDLLEAFERAAALRYTYCLDTLTPAPASLESMMYPRYEDLSPRKREAVFAYVTGRSEIVSDASGHARWMLNDEQRREALKRLIESGVLAGAIELARADAAKEKRMAAEEEKRAAENVTTQAQGDATPSPDSEPPIQVSEARPDESGADLTEKTLWKFLSTMLGPAETSEENMGKAETLGRRQLLVNQRVVAWLHDLHPELKVPSPQEVSRQLARETMLQPFRHLTGEWKDGVFVSTFSGRGEELRRLYDYLSVLPPETFFDRLRRAYRSVLDSAWSIVNRTSGHRPLLIYGLGGVGKSSLLAKFLLDHLTETKPALRFPYAYLDFDLSSLSAREPLTLLAEAARQLAAQYPAFAELWESARAQWTAASQDSTPSQLESPVRLKALDQFVSLLRDSGNEGVSVSEQLEHRHLPFLLVLDTFEELQYHDRDAVKDVFRFLNILGERLPALRCIIMGRAALGEVEEEYGDLEAIVVEGDHFSTGLATDFNVIEVPLGDLSKDEAQDYLRRQGIDDEELSAELVDVLGGSPLSLRLISRVFKEGNLNLESLREDARRKQGVGWRPWRWNPPKSLLQGVLFDRILGHIHLQNVRSLAHPGLLLRRVTPELIKDVLACPCGLGQLSAEQAHWYYNQLAREVALVGTDRDPQGEDIIRHRPELRRIMLRLMAADEEKQEQMRQVHENAANYYAKLPGRVAREEELYHRLMLEEPPRAESLLDEVPTDEALEAGYASAPEPGSDPRQAWRALTKSAEEIPPSGKAYLAARLLEDSVTDAEWEVADRRDWELIILGRASRRARARGNIMSALHGLRRERERMLTGNDNLSPLSPLPLLETALLERLGNFDEAEERVKESLSRLKTTKNSFRRSSEYNLLGARLAARTEQDEKCLAYLKQATKMSDALASVKKGGIASFRLDIQSLRFATDCYNLLPSAGIFEALMTFLFRLLKRPEGLWGRPVLARYVVSSVVPDRTANGKRDGVKDVHSLALFGDLLDSIQSHPLLLPLLRWLPKGIASEVAEVLAHWTQEALSSGADRDSFKDLVQLPAKTKESVRLRENWEQRLGDPAGSVAEPLARAFKEFPLSKPRLIDFCEALKPGQSNERADEAPFEEARHSGDLLPGEGDAAFNHQTSQKL